VLYFREKKLKLYLLSRILKFADIHSETGNQHQRVLIFDDEWDSISTALASDGDCKTQMDSARQSYSIAQGGTDRHTFHITGIKERQWFVAVQNCDPITNVGYTVSLNSVEMVASNNVVCENIGGSSSTNISGFVVSIVLLSLLLVSASVALFMMWQKMLLAKSSTRSINPIDGERTNYDEL